MDNEKTSNAIRAARIAAGYTQAQVAVKLGKSQTAVAAWETGRSQPTASTIAELAQLYGVSSDYLLGLSDYYSDTHREVIEALFGEFDGSTFANQITQLIGKLSSLPDYLDDQTDIVNGAVDCVSSIVGEFNKLISCFVTYCGAYNLGNAICVLNRDFTELSGETASALPDDVRNIFSEFAEYEKNLITQDPSQFAGEALDGIERMEGGFAQFALSLQNSLNGVYAKFRATVEERE